VTLNLQRIGPVEIKALPKAQVLIEKAEKAKNPQDAIALLKEAAKIDPQSPVATFNLGVLINQNGKIQEGMSLVMRSVEIDPNYMYGHATLALINADSNKTKALEHLEIIDHATIISPDTAIVANLAKVELAIQAHDWETARQHLELAEQINPRHPLVEKYAERIDDAEDMTQKMDQVFKRQEKSTARAHKKLHATPLTAETNLHTCLEAYTKDMLIGCAEFLRTTTYGNKNELIDWLTELLLDKDFLQETLDEDLEEDECAALTWLLQKGGICPWEEFTSQYDDDAEESPNWKLYFPESIAGTLKASGLLFTGTLNGQVVAFIPTDLRPLLRELLKA
jgi:tetratricopeptide (TPR) repeat protein